MSDKKRRIMLKDVANAAGVSIATASVVLNKSNRVHISKQTRDSVVDAANTLGYVLKPRKSNADNLDFKSSKRIALLVNQISRDIFIDALQSVNECALQNDFVLQIMSFSDDKKQREDLLKEIRQQKFDGLIIANCVTAQVDDFEEHDDLPVVLLNCFADKKLKCPVILPSDVNGGHIVTEHFIEQGCKNIAFIGGEAWMCATKDRLLGYRRALASNDIAINDELISFANWNVGTAYRETLRLMALPTPPDAFFACSDDMSIGIYMALKELGARIPEDVAVCGYDDLTLASSLVPDLSSYKLPYSDMGSLAVNTLIQRISGQPLNIKRFKQEGELVVRTSSRK